MEQHVIITHGGRYSPVAGKTVIKRAGLYGVLSEEIRSPERDRCFCWHQQEDDWGITCFNWIRNDRFLSSLRDGEVSSFSSRLRRAGYRRRGEWVGESVVG